MRESEARGRCLGSNGDDMWVPGQVGVTHERETRERAFFGGMLYEPGNFAPAHHARRQLVSRVR